MSKLWLPPSKMFGDRSASVLRRMPVVRIKGVETNSPLGHELLSHFAGRIGQFHMAQAQNYSLAPQAIYKGRREYSDVRMQYTNLDGQEFIAVEVHPAIIEEILRRPEVINPHDVMVIDLYMFGYFSNEDPSIGGDKRTYIDAYIKGKPDQWSGAAPFGGSVAGASHNLPEVTSVRHASDTNDYFGNVGVIPDIFEAKPTISDLSGHAYESAAGFYWNAYATPMSIAVDLRPNGKAAPTTAVIGASRVSGASVTMAASVRLERTAELLTVIDDFQEFQNGLGPGWDTYFFARSDFAWAAGSGDNTPIDPVNESYTDGPPIRTANPGISPYSFESGFIGGGGGMPTPSSSLAAGDIAAWGEITYDPKKQAVTFSQ